MGKEFGFEVDVPERTDTEKLGMGSFLSVGRASANPCKLVVMHDQGGEAGDQPVVLVGKGITFDTGGIIATLTGACVIALGAHASGLFANDQALASELLTSGTETGDRAGQLLLWDDDMGQLKTNLADISNPGGPPAGAITAALFLSRFAQAYPWAHIDIAGTGSVFGEAKGSTGLTGPAADRLSDCTRHFGPIETGLNGKVPFPCHLWS